MDISPSVVITVLAALLTGGFLILTIENVHLSASVSDRYYSVMKPFFHKLTKYVEFIKMVRYHFRFQQTNNEYAQDLKQIIDTIANLKRQSVVGLDISGSAFTAKELDDFCEKTIGNVWYFASEKWNLIKDDVGFDNKNIDDITIEYLNEVSEKYKGCDINIELIANVSDDFDRNIYQPIQNVPFQFEEWEELEKEFIHEFVNFRKENNLTQELLSIYSNVNNTLVKISQVLLFKS